MKKNIGKKWIFLIGLVICGFISDVVIHCTGKYLLPLTDEYLYSLFGAIVTIAILCFSIIALIFGAIDRDYLGYKIKEIINFPNSKVSIKSIILISLVYVIMALGILCFNGVYNVYCSMTLVFVSLCLYECYTIFKVCELILNDDELYKTVKEYLDCRINEEDQSFDRINNSINTLINAMKDNIVNQNGESLKNIAELLHILLKRIDGMSIENKMLFRDVFNLKFRVCLNDLARAYGYNEMISFINYIYNDIGDLNYLKQDLYIEPLERIKFYTNEEINKANYFNEIKAILIFNKKQKESLEYDDISFIILNYFNNVYSNELITTSTKKTLLEDVIKECCDSIGVRSKEYHSIYYSVLINILIEYILKNSDRDMRNYLYCAFVKHISYRITICEDAYSELITSFYQLFYSAIFREIEVFSRQHREDLKETFMLKIKGTYIDEMTSSEILSKYSETILKTLAKRISKEDDMGCNSSFEIFPDYMKVKTTVWTRSFDITYMMLIYLIYPGWYNDMIYYYSNWDNITQENKKGILNDYRRCFNDDGSLKETIIESYNQYCNLLQTESSIDLDIADTIFEQINYELKKLKTEEISNNSKFKKDNKIDINKVDNLITQFAKQCNMNEWSDDINVKQNINVNIAPYTISKELQENF